MKLETLATILLATLCAFLLGTLLAVPERPQSQATGVCGPSTGAPGEL